MARPLRRALAAWALVAFVVWNGIFDAVIRQAEYAFLGRRAMHELGLGPGVMLDFAMADAQRLAVRAATQWAALVLCAGLAVSLYLVRAAARQDAAAAPPAD